MSTISLTRKDLEDYASKDAGLYGLDISRISSFFLFQVMKMRANQTINTHQIFDEIKALEGVGRQTSTKPAEPFRRLPLKGLMKTHFTDAVFIVKNIGSHFGFDSGGNKNIDKLIKEAFKKNTSEFPDDKFFMNIANGCTFDALKERARKNRITGEWIVFQEHNNKNYYLTLAAHDEGDENIYKRVCDAYDFDFPFLRNDAKEL